MSAPLGWGRDPYGLSSYGGTSKGVALGIVSAVALSTRTVQVTLSSIPEHVVNTAPGDALNPLTWNIQRLDTNAFLHVVAVSIDSPTIYTLTTIENFGPANVTHVVSSNTLLNETGNPITAPNSAQFLGALAESATTALAQAVQNKLASRDVNNPFTANQQGASGGTLVISAGGDYTNVTGTDLLTKLIQRRLTTSPGGFFHLPNYGAGIQEKEILTVSNLTQLKALVEAQVRLEPEVDDVVATLLLNNNQLTIQLAVKVKGQKSQVNVNVSQPVSGFVV